MARTKRTVAVHRTDKRELRRLALLEPTPEGIERPRTRGDCLEGGINAERPCPFAACRYHLVLDVRPNGSVTFNFPDLELEQLEDTCALDVADRDGATLEQIAARMNITRERVRQVEEQALEKRRLELEDMCLQLDL